MKRYSKKIIEAKNREVHKNEYFSPFKHIKT